MASGVFSAIQEKFDSLTYIGKPNQLWFGEAPLKDPDGNNVDLPLAQMYHESAGDITTFEYPSIQLHRIRFEVYAYQLDQVEHQCMGILFDNQDPQLAAGLAYTSSLPLPSTYQFLQFRITSLPVYRRIAQQRAQTTQAAHMGTFSMELEIQYVG